MSFSFAESPLMLVKFAGLLNSLYRRSSDKEGGGRRGGGGRGEDGSKPRFKIVGECSGTGDECLLLLLSFLARSVSLEAALPFRGGPVVRSRGLFSEVGVSHELESELKLPARLLISRICFRRLARRPSHGDLSPMSESMGKSFGGSRDPRSRSAVEERFSGEKSTASAALRPLQTSAVLGVVKTGVMSMSSLLPPLLAAVELDPFVAPSPVKNER